VCQQQLAAESSSQTHLLASISTMWELGEITLTERDSLFDLVEARDQRIFTSLAKYRVTLHTRHMS
jgi:hypothetical protein